MRVSILQDVLEESVSDAKTDGQAIDGLNTLFSIGMYAIDSINK